MAHLSGKSFSAGDKVTWNKNEAGSGSFAHLYGEGPFTVQSIKPESPLNEEAVSFFVSRRDTNALDGENHHLKAFSFTWMRLV